MIVATGRRFYGRACKTMLKGVSVARLTLWKPPALITSQTRASLACAGRRTDLLRQRGRHADHHRTRVIKVGRPGSNCLRGGEWEIVAPQRLGIYAIWHDGYGVGLPANSPIRPDRIIRRLSESREEPNRLAC